jgi:phosphate transport system substrate-binding protein
VGQNPGVPLEDLPISVVYRTDGSGTTAIYTDFLADASTTWQRQVGSGRNVRWPVGLGAKGSEGVAQQVRSVPGAIGYVEVAYATQAGLKSGLIRNRAGRFVGPAVASMTAAARAVSTPRGLRGLHVPLMHATAEDAYSLSAYTYVLVYRDSGDRRKAEALARFLWWALHDGQRLTTPLGYAPLPGNVVPEVESALLSLSANHEPVLRRE